MKSVLGREWRCESTRLEHGSVDDMLYGLAGTFVVEEMVKCLPTCMWT